MLWAIITLQLACSDHKAITLGAQWAVRLRRVQFRLLLKHMQLLRFWLRNCYCGNIMVEMQLRQVIMSSWLCNISGAFPYTRAGLNQLGLTHQPNAAGHLHYNRASACTIPPCSIIE